MRKTERFGSPTNSGARSAKRTSSSSTSAFIGSASSRRYVARRASNQSRRLFFRSPRRNPRASRRKPRNGVIALRPSPAVEPATPGLIRAELPREYVHRLLRVASYRHEQVQQQEIARRDGVHDDVAEVQEEYDG